MALIGLCAVIGVSQASLPKTNTAYGSEEIVRAATEPPFAICDEARRIATRHRQAAGVVAPARVNERGGSVCDQTQCSSGPGKLGTNHRGRVHQVAPEDGR
jgi:hypothetical protein